MLAITPYAPSHAVTKCDSGASPPAGMPATAREVRITESPVSRYFCQVSGSSAAPCVSVLWPGSNDRVVKPPQDAGNCRLAPTLVTLEPSDAVYAQYETPASSSGCIGSGVQVELK